MIIKFDTPGIKVYQNNLAIQKVNVLNTEETIFNDHKG